MALAVTEARTLVGLQASDSSKDTRLQQLIDAAYEQAAYFCGPLTPSVVTETARSRRGQLLLRQRPVTELTAVAGVTDLTALQQYGRTGLIEGLPSTVVDGDVVVTYVVGYATVPASIEEGVRAWVKHRWLQESYGTDTYGTDAVTEAVTDFDGLPNAVRNAWEPYLLDRGVGIG